MADSLDTTVTCTTCGFERAPTDFHHGYRMCKPCTRIQHNKYAHEHKDSIRAYQKIWNSENRQKIKERRIANRIEISVKAKAKYQRTKQKITLYREANLSRLLLNGARARSRKLNLPFDLTVDWIEAKLSAGYCEVSGIAFNCKQGIGHKWDGPTLDRIKPELGYVIGNVRMIIYRANVAMHDHGIDGLLMIADAIRAHIAGGRR